MHIIKFVDYFSKLDETRICRLKIIVRKMADVFAAQDIIGSPQEIQQFMLSSKKSIPRYEPEYFSKPTQDVTAKKIAVKENERLNGGSEETSIKIENTLDNDYLTNTQIIAHNNNNHRPVASINMGPTAATAIKTKK